MTEVTRYQAIDGWLAQTEAQCLAYELRLSLQTLGKKLDSQMNINEFGQIDPQAVARIATNIVADLQSMLDKLDAAWKAFAERAGA